jgi:zinc/manganese transport system substrate-binding protein
MWLMEKRHISRNLGIIIGLLLVLMIIAVFTSGNQKSSSQKIQVVAAENFWGSLVSQLGGNKVNVVSIVSDPNADPHEYEGNAKDARDFAEANYVILNGAGYDTWANKLVSASPNSARTVLTVADLVHKKEGDNPHLWYNPAYVNTAIKQMEKNLIALDPKDKSYFASQYVKLQVALAPYQNRIKSIANLYKGEDVAATEDIFAYLAGAAKLNLISPESFTEAVAEGNDPPASSVVTFQNQLEAQQPKVLVYNEQTVTPLTDSIKKQAAQEGIPVVGITETIQPPNTSFEDWMNSELINLENALNSKELGQ